MIRKRIAGLLMAIGLVASLSPTAVAQDGDETPEGIDWSLTSYLGEDSADTTAVPFGVVATLRMEDGTASGSGGCNAFSGSYRLQDEALIFSEELTRTLRLCDDEIQDVEDTYLTNLALVASWTMIDGVLEFYDDFDDVILTFEVPDVVLTAGQLAGLLDTIADLQAELARLDERLDNANVPRIRERLSDLEDETARLQRQLNQRPQATPRPTPRPTAAPPSGDFSRAERVLLGGIPSRIASRCESWRQITPPGTVASVRCTPNTNATASVIYHLMEGQDARNAFLAEMNFRGVPENLGPACRNGNRGWRTIDPDFGWVTEGCDRDPGPSVYVAFTDWATDCRQLNVDGERIRNPAWYITLIGNHNDIARTYEWATRASLAIPGKLTSIADNIPTNLRLSPACDFTP